MYRYANEQRECEVEVILGLVAHVGDLPEEGREIEKELYVARLLL